ncbi:MAG TPA: hypothetical protein VFB67_10040 [Candidatus Polarisedimenticolaceae bacterium]|nr:hypothetical protein [Candidatus Polarisedimenticolaceae bacterium]
MRRGLGTVALALLLAPTGPAHGRSEADRAAYLALLHDGRFDAAQAALDARPGAVGAEELFFDAFTTYWRLIFDDENPELQALLESQLESAIAAAESGSAQGGSAHAALWGGTSHLLLAQLRASQRHPLGAAFEAKKAKRMLEVASREGADTSDALFGLGTYNYMADTVPSYVKGLRALLFLPKGNRELGLSQIREAAEKSRTFGLEARILLVTVYANKHERLYDQAIAERDRMAREAPPSIATIYAGARLDLSLGRNDASLARLARAEERAGTLGDVDPVVLRSIDLLRARAEYALLRPDLAAVTAERALAAGRGLGPVIKHDLEEIRASSKRESQGIEWSRIHEVDQLARAHPDRPLLALLAGDAALRAGRAEEAVDWLAKASSSRLPPALDAACKLRQGQASDLLGRRPEALALYKSAAQTPGFSAKDAALYYQRAPYRGST